MTALPTYKHCVYANKVTEDKVTALRAKHISIAEMLRAGVDLYWKAETEARLVPEALINKAKSIV